MDIFTYYLSEDISMIKACIDNDINLCKKIFNENNQMINKKNINLRNPFHASCIVGNLEISKWIYENCCKETMNDKDKQGHYPLYSACREGNLDIIKWLYDIGIRDITKGDLLGQKPIWFLCNHSYIEIEKRKNILLFFLEKGIQIDDKNNEEDKIYNSIFNYLYDKDLKKNLIESVESRLEYLKNEAKNNIVIFNSKMNISILTRKLNIFFDKFLIQNILCYIFDISNIKNLSLFELNNQNI